MNFYYRKSSEGSGVENLLLNGYAMYEHKAEPDWIGSDLSPLYGDTAFYQAFQYYMLPQILSTYGPPPQALVFTAPDDPWNYITFVLILFDPEQGTFLEYEMPRKTIGDNFVGCPLSAQVRVVSASPEQGFPLEYFVDKAGGMVNSSWLVSFQPIDVATSMTMDEFYQVFQNSESTSCIETPIEIWNP